MQATLAHTDDLIIDLRKQLLMGVVARVADAGKRLDHEHMAAVATRILGDEVTASELKELQDEVPDLFKRRPLPEFEERRKPHQQADRVVLLVANWHLRPLAAAGGED